MDEDTIMNDEELEDLKEEMQEEDLEEQQELREELSESDSEAYGVSEPERVYERFKFLTEVRDMPETIKTGYLTKPELGFPLFPVRFWLNLELIAALKKYQILRDYLHDKSTITTSSSLSRDGFLLNTAITRRKETKKQRTKSVQEVANAKK